MNTTAHAGTHGKGAVAEAKPMFDERKLGLTCSGGPIASIGYFRHESAVRAAYCRCCDLHYRRSLIRYDRPVAKKIADCPRGCASRGRRNAGYFKVCR